MTETTRERDKDQTRRRILDAAADVFSEKGYHSASVDDIVRVSGTSKGAIYFHFPNKQTIFLSLVDYLTRLLVERVDGAVRGQSGGVNRVDAALRTVLETIGRNPHLARILFLEALGIGQQFDQRLMNIHVRFAEAIERYLARAVADGDIPLQDTELAAYAWLGAVNEIITRWLYTGQPDPLESAVPALRDHLLRSIGAPLPVVPSVAPLEREVTR